MASSIMGRLVTLQSLRDELEQLAAWDRVREAGDRRERERDRREQGRAPGVERVEIPWAGSWWMTDAQRDAVRGVLEWMAGLRPRPLPAETRAALAGLEGWERIARLPG